MRASVAMLLGTVVFASASAPAAALAIQVGTVQELREAVAKVRPGDAVELRAGSYSLDGPLLLSQPGPAVLRGIGKAEAVVLSGRAGQEVIRVIGSSWQISRLTLRGTIGVHVAAGADNARLDGLRVEGANVGIELGDPADLLCALSGAVLTNNVLARVRNEAILLNAVCDARIQHQTVFSAGRALLVQGPSNPPLLANNLWSTDPGIRGMGDLVLSAPSAPEWFVGAGQGDFHLRPASPPVDRGVFAGVTTDADGNPRPRGMAPDVGAYELDPAGGGAGADLAAPAGGVVAGGGGSGKGSFEDRGISCAAGGGGGLDGALVAAAIAASLRRRRRARPLAAS